MAIEPIPNDWIAEEEIASRLSVDREKIRAERPHLAAAEFKRLGNFVVWQRAAAARIARKLNLPAVFDEKTAPAVAEEGEQLSVFSTPGPGGWHFGNHYLIRAARATGEVVVVRVMDSRKYVPKMRDGKPMVLRAKKSPAGNWWTLIGREPRFTGAW